MPSYAFETVDVFTDRRFGGNQLAVFPDARGLSDADMQSLAAEFNLSETTFVLPPEDPAHTARVRIFNRSYEMPFAGHPNVGTGCVLARHGLDRDGVLRFEELSGLVEVRVERDAAGAVTGAVIAAPQPLTTLMELPPEAIAACVGLAPGDILTTVHRPVLASVGIPFVLVEVTGEALTRATPDIAAFRRTQAEFPGIERRLSLHLYARDAAAPDIAAAAGARIRARMFAPLSGTYEDPATGSANATLGALLLSLSGAESGRAEIAQGVEMGRPSLLHVAARRGADGVRATVGGGCVPVLKGEAEV
ncbi:MULTISPECIES: PhzF family phenazine biosynthesis protein [unclassified Inquilinus]|uniref:PhzF family phenazine biosynthesis protein n=1 Tax=unclassified Inquilinus TaxID=2645927 RepID=UPI003F9344ED